MERSKPTSEVIEGSFDIRVEALTVEYPNVTLCYEVKVTFLNSKLNQTRTEIANF